MLNQFIVILPEILLAALAMIAQILGVYYKKCVNQIIILTSVASGAIILYILYCAPSDIEINFSSSFAISPMISWFKAIILLLTIMSIIIYHNLMCISKSEVKMEFITLLLLSTVGVFVSISSRDCIILFCGLELQALSGYALAAFDSKNSKSSEAGLKYFVLGALMSALMLLGISFLYGFSGSIKFVDIQHALNGEFNIGLIVGAILLLSAILFKLSAAPLHIWTPDVYEGSPIASVSYFAVAQKIGMLMVLINILEEVIGDYSKISVELIKIIAILSMVIGALGAIFQSSLKRLMAYSTILNIGYVLVAVCVSSSQGDQAAYMYMLIYAIGVMGFFACIIALFGDKSDTACFEDLKGIASKRKTIAAAISIIMFSMIGIPPLAGFFGKYYIFYNAILEGEILLSIIGVLTSVIAAFYYLKIIKFMYFIESNDKIIIIPTNKGLLFVTVISVGFITCFCMFVSTFL